MDASYTPVILTSDRKTLQIQTSAGHVVGRLESRYSKILQALRDEDDVELQAYVVRGLSQVPPKDQAKKTLRQLTSSRVKTMSLSVILYGPMELFEVIGEFFEQCSEFLQSPLHCDRNLPYRNPQSLSGRDTNPPMTFQLEADLCRPQIETMVQVRNRLLPWRPRIPYQKQKLLPSSRLPYTSESYIFSSGY